MGLNVDTHNVNQILLSSIFWKQISGEHQLHIDSWDSTTRTLLEAYETQRDLITEAKTV
jgi:hypothetical protein